MIENIKYFLFTIILCTNYMACGFLFSEGCGPGCYPIRWKTQTLNETADWDVPIFAMDTSGDLGPIQVRFLLFNRQTKNDPDCFILNTSKNIYENFDRSKPIKILVHGWIGSIKTEFIETVLNTYLPAFDYNVIVVLWEQESRRVYPLARKALPTIGKMLAEFIDLLCDQYDLSPNNMHILGHSLGAHISGIAGYYIKSGVLGRITGLDPALPLFEDDLMGRISKKSASFVDIIHTCGIYLGWFGAIGHVDFYPNRGVPVQPGCGIDVFGICSHGRSYAYYSETIKDPNKLLAARCDTWDMYKHKRCEKKFVRMGEALPVNATGVYYLTTNSKTPFGRGLNIFL